MAQHINCDDHPAPGQADEPHGNEANQAQLRGGGDNRFNDRDTPEDNAVADAELMVWGAKAALKVAERNLRVAYETLASVLGERNNGTLAVPPLSSAERSPLRSGEVEPPGHEPAHNGAGVAGGPGDSSEPDDPRSSDWGRS